MIHRKVIEKLRAWRDSADRKPLVLRGARQVGKTTLVREFAKEFDTFLYLNLERQEHNLIFEKTDDVRFIFESIVVNQQVAHVGEKVLLFIDEIQNSPKAVALLRYFYEEMPHIYVIAAGSLLESLMHTRRISFPVGRVQYMMLRPCTFLEFLDGLHEDFDKQLVEEQHADRAHDRMMRLFKEYLLVGGMPDVINTYAQQRNIHDVRDVYASLLESYSNDVEKYANTKQQADIVRMILNKGWLSAAETITFEHFGDTRFPSRDVSTAFALLEKTLLLELVYPSVSAQLPILTNTRMRPKLLWLDTGLVNFMAGIQLDVFNSEDINSIWRGRIAEHIVAQELLTIDDHVLNHRAYWRRNKAGSDAEVDFIYSYKGLLLPIEVKSGHNAHLRSLHAYMDEAPHDYAIRIWSEPFSIDEVQTPSGKWFRLINVPFYYVGMLDKVLTMVFHKNS